LPGVDVVSQLIIDLFGVDDPQCLIVEPDFDVILSILEGLEEIPVCVFEDDRLDFEQYIVVVLLASASDG